MRISLSKCIVLAVATLSTVALVACGSETPTKSKSYTNPPGGQQNTNNNTNTNNNNNTDDDQVVDSCSVGTCTAISGGSVCLVDGGLPTGAATCNPTDGSGCPTDRMPVSTSDGGCVCLEDCSTGGGGDPDTTCSAGTCTAIDGGSVCLDNGNIPAGAASCNPSDGSGCPTDRMPVGTSDGGCVCLEECAGSDGGGDTGGDCTAGTCTEIEGGAICLDNGNAPAGSASCNATDGSGCPTDRDPYGTSDGGCICLETCAAGGGGTDGGTGGECPASTTCTPISGGSVCLSSGQIPAGAASCNPSDGSGCPTGQEPVSTSDGGCVCLTPC